MTLKTLCLVAVMSLGLTGVANAQDANLGPTFGTMTVDVNFVLQRSQGIQAGGPVRAADTVACPGFISHAPVMRVFNETDYVRFGVSRYDSAHEFTVIVLGPQGWSCTDDRMGQSLEFVFEDRGRYDIWVGTYYPNQILDPSFYVDSGPEYFGNR